MHLEDIYGTEVSADLISTVTDGVVEEVREWQSRPLENIYRVNNFFCVNSIKKSLTQTSNKSSDYNCQNK